MKNILLERFPSAGVDAFERELKDLIKIRLVVYNGEKFPVSNNIEAINTLSITKGIGIDSCPWLMENSSMRRLSHYEGIFLSVLSRYDVYKKSFTTEEMLEHYYRLVNFWINKIKDIDIIFSLDTPHVPSSFALYIASKILKKPFIYLDCPLVYNRFQFFGCSFEYRALLVENEGKTASEFISEHEIFKSNYKSNSVSVTSKYVTYLATRTERLWWRMLVEDINSSFPISIKAIFDGKIKIRKLYTTELGWKTSRRRWDDPKSGFMRPFLFFAKLKDRIKIILARRRYRNLCEDHNTLGEYILFAPSMEPEAAILPTALEGRYTFSALKLISEELPEGVNIVYKENPGQFDQQVLFTTEWKNKFYYEDLKRIKNIIFVRDDAYTRDLITDSIGVATLNGTIGLEAIIAGRHCITFASQWYDSLDGLHRVKTSKDISMAVKLMLNKDEPNPQPNQVNFSKNFVDMDGCNTKTYSTEDFKKICLGMWSSYNDFLEIDDRKWGL